jgi:hypothetical protein
MPDAAALRQVACQSSIGTGQRGHNDACNSRRKRLLQPYDCAEAAFKAPNRTLNICKNDKLALER